VRDQAVIDESERGSKEEPFSFIVGRRPGGVIRPTCKGTAPAQAIALIDAINFY
jgi:hypothetical protein